jgi:isoleucyl-tRNA synthetase
LIAVREAVSKALEEVRQQGGIGNSLEAKLTIRASGQTHALLSRHEADLRYIFIVSQVTLEQAPAAADGLQVGVARAEGSKCERCWNYSVHVGRDAAYQTLCERCAPVVARIQVQ